LDGIGLLGWVVLAPFAVVDLGSRPIRAWLLPSVATQGLAATTADVAGTAGSSTLCSLLRRRGHWGFVAVDFEQRQWGDFASTVRASRGEQRGGSGADDGSTNGTRGTWRNPRVTTSTVI
jgi:hypothetical protein